MTTPFFSYSHSIEFKVIKKNDIYYSIIKIRIREKCMKRGINPYMYDYESELISRFWSEISDGETEMESYCHLFQWETGLGKSGGRSPFPNTIVLDPSCRGAEPMNKANGVKTKKYLEVNRKSYRPGDKARRLGCFPFSILSAALSV